MGLRTPVKNKVSIFKPITPTMSSLEIVDYINQERKEKSKKEGVKFKELRHDHFMQKVPKVIGELTAPKFLGTNNYKNGKGGYQKRSIYNFPKREACLMAMSYSYEIQAKVYDRMTELEEGTAMSLVMKLQNMWLKSERHSFTEHGQKGSRLMLRRKKEKRQLLIIENQINQISQLNMFSD